jgi:hypothetical protein
MEQRRAVPLTEVTKLGRGSRCTAQKSLALQGDPAARRSAQLS